MAGGHEHELRRTIRAGLDRIASDLTTLLGVPVRMNGRELTLLDGASLATLSPRSWRAETVLITSGEGPVGILLPEDAVLACGAALMMMPVAEEVTEDMLGAFEELVNVAVGSWNAVVDASHRMSNDISHRSTLSMPAERASAWYDEGSRTVLTASMEVGGQQLTLGLFGPRTWLALSPPASEDDADGGDVAAMKATDDDAFPDAPRGASGPGFVLIDESGALGDWLQAQMAEGTLKFYRGRAGDPVSPGTTVLLLNASAESVTGLAGAERLVIRR